MDNFGIMVVTTLTLPLLTDHVIVLQEHKAALDIA